MLSLLKKSMSFLNEEKSSNYYSENMKTWENSLNCYNQSQYLESISLLMKYINPEFDQKIEENKNYEIKEGSSVVNLKVENNYLNLKVNFLKHNGEIPIALLRKLADMNMNNFVLSVIRTSDTHIYVEYSERLELSHPFKIYNVLDEMLYQTDLYDDLFAKKFNLSLGDDSNELEPRSNIEDLWNTFQENVKETEERLAEYKSKNYMNYIFDPYFTFCNKTLFCLSPEGYLKSLIIETDNYGKSRMDFELKLKKIEKTFKKIKEITKEEFTECMYESKKFFTGKTFINSQNLQRSIGSPQFTQMHEKGVYLLNSVYGEGKAFSVLNHYHLNGDVKELILEGLNKASTSVDHKFRSDVFTNLYKKLDHNLLKLDNTKVA